MNYDLQKTVAFTGHRTYRGTADAALTELLNRLYERGFRCFLSGGAVGFDLTAAEAVIELRERHREVCLVAVVPFAEQSLRFPAAEKARYERVMRLADETILLSPGFHAGCYALRNDYLVDHAALLVAWFDGSTGGTEYTVRRAERLCREVIHLHPQPERAVQGDLFR